MDEWVWVVPPQGEDDEGIGWQLKKALYGTRQASFLFQSYVMEVLLRAGFIRTTVTV